MDISKLMEQAKVMQEKMQSLQDEVAQIKVAGAAGVAPQIVKVIMNGKHELEHVIIDPSLIQTENEGKTLLQELVAAAVNDATRKLEKETRDKMGGLAGDLPPEFQMPS